MYLGLVICAIGAAFGLVQYMQTKALPVHASMANVSNTIWETCKTYLFTQGKFLAILWVLIAACMVYYFGVLAAQQRPAARHRDPARVRPRHSRLLRRGVVRHSHQHGRQFPHGLFRAQRQSARHARHPAELRHERRPAARRGGTVLHDLHPGVPAARTGRAVLHRLRHRRIARRVRAPHLRRHLHQDRRHRLRPDEDRFQTARRRSEESRRDRGLHRRQCRRFRRPDGGRLRNLRRHRRRADRVSRAGAGGHARASWRR